MAGRIVVDDTRMDAAAAKISSAQAALQGVQGRLTPALSAGAPPAVKGQVDAAVAEARATVAGVAGRCSARSTELRRRAILTRIAGGDIREIDLRQLIAWNAKNPFIGARVGNGKGKVDGGILGALKGFAGGVGDVTSDVAGAIGHGVAVGGHTTLDVVGLIPGLGEPADGINGLVYAAEGDKVNAGLSFAGMIPFLGWGATGGKLGGKVVHAVDAGGGAAGKGVEGAGKSVSSPGKKPDTGYHHTSSKAVDAIEKDGLWPGSFVTDRIYSPKDATIRLSLPQKNANPDAVFEVDLAKMREDKIELPHFTTVKPKYGQPGGGMEIEVAGRIPPEYLKFIEGAQK